MFAMSDSRWAAAYTNRTSWKTMQGFGAPECCIAQALVLSGYTDQTPRTVASAMASHATYLPDGLVDYDKLHTAYPQFVSGRQQWSFVQGRVGNLLITVLVSPDGTVYDPLTGLNSYPPGFAATGVTRTASIDPKA